MRWGSHMQSCVLNCTCVHVCCTQDASNPENEYALRVLAAGKESALCAMVLDAWPRAFINGSMRIYIYIYVICLTLDAGFRIRCSCRGFRGGIAG